MTLGGRAAEAITFRRITTGVVCCLIVITFPNLKELEMI